MTTPEPRLIDIRDYRNARLGWGQRRDAALFYAEVTNPERDLDLVAFARRGEPPGVRDRLHADAPCDCEPKDSA